MDGSGRVDGRVIREFAVDETALPPSPVVVQFELPQTLGAGPIGVNCAYEYRQRIGVA
jgi:hypothetical protein